MAIDSPAGDLEALVRHSADVSTVLDEAGTVMYETASIERFLGYDPGQLGGEQFLDAVHPDDRAAAAAVVDGPAPGDDEEPPTEAFRFRHADGSWLWLEAVGAVGSAGSYVVDARDVTERRASHRERKAVLDRMTDGFFALNDAWEFTYLNDRAVTLLGQDREALLGSELQSVFSEATDSVAYDRIEEAVATGTTVSFECDPLEAHFEIRAYPDESGVTVYFRDVTEQRAVRSELEESVRALHSLYEIAADQDLTFETKRDRLLELGQSYLGLAYGFATRIEDGTQTIEAATGSHELLQPGETCPLEQSYCRKTIAVEEILSVAAASEEGWDDDRAFEVFGLGSYVGAKLVVDGDLYGTLCFASSEPQSDAFTDSERTFVELAARWMAYELEERRYRERLEDRNDRLEEFASIVSHDLRNPLNVAQGELDLARSERDSEHLELVAESHDRMSTLIEDLLTLAREGEDLDAVEPVALATLLDDCWETVETSAATLRVETDVVVRGDPTRLQQLFENLFRNSIEHGHPAVTVSVGEIPGDGFYVADDGPGIPEEHCERVFEGEFTTDEAGTGFGLRIVEQITAAHDWTVAVTDATDGGARFEFRGVELAD